MDIQLQQEYIRNTLDAAIPPLLPGQDSTFRDRVEEFLTDGCDGLNLRPFDIVSGSSAISIEWPAEGQHQRQLTVTFMSNTTDWRWDASERVLDPWATATESGDGYVCTYSHDGACTYYHRDTPHYNLPALIEKLITIPDTFEGTYSPTLSKDDYNIVWVTNVYDGPLSGYCEIDGVLHYFDDVEETMYERKRMYAVYKLSFMERTRSRLARHKWNVMCRYAVMWKLYTARHRFWRKYSYTNLLESKLKFIKTHKIVGYFTS